MKIISWNIKQGGGKRINSILETIESWEADLLFLIEYRPNSNLTNGLQKLGYNLTFSQTDTQENSILCATKLENINTVSAPPTIPSNHWLEFKLENFNILSVQVPTSGGKYDQNSFWEQLFKYAEANKNQPTLILGDFNAVFEIEAPNSNFALGKELEKIIESGWIDLMKNFRPDFQDFTWYSRSKVGFRLDHALGNSNFLSLVGSVEYLHKVRKAEISDHSAILITTN